MAVGLSPIARLAATAVAVLITGGATPISAAVMPSPHVVAGVDGHQAAAATAPPGDCDDHVDDAWLSAAFDTGIGTDPVMTGADYQRAFELGDGRVLWVFQDAYVETASGTSLVHNAGAIQDGSCFEVLVGGNDAAGSWVGAAETVDFREWYWPLDGYQSDDDTFVLLVAQMRETGATYLTRTEPIATWQVAIDLGTLGTGREVGPLHRAPDPSAALYGFDITADDTYRYYYAQCHRQFGFGWLGHDDCAATVTVMREPLDGPTAPLEYWDGERWQRNSRAAANIAPTTLPDGTPRTANPMQIERSGDSWIAATKVDDWWGDEVVFDVAPSPEGPWTTKRVVRVASEGPLLTEGVEHGETVASYFVSFVPSDDGGMTLAMSNNRWDGKRSDHYRPRFGTVPLAAWGLP